MGVWDSEISSDFFRVTQQRQLRLSECDASDTWVTASPAHLCCEHRLWLLMSLVSPGWSILAEGTGTHFARSDRALGGGAGTGELMLLCEDQAGVQRWRQPVQRAELFG